MISRADVALAYQLILGRDPENDTVVDKLVNQKNVEKLTYADLGAQFLQSVEFRSKRGHLVRSTRLRSQDCNALNVETRVTPALLDRLFKHVESAWCRLGNVEPHFSVLTNKKFKPENVAENMDEFYESAVANVNAFRKSVERCDVDIGRFRDCFELGCGVGRITIKLAELFNNVIAADVSAPYLELAKAKLEEQGINNVRLLQMNSVESYFNLPEYDVFFSLIVLQHNPPPVMDVLLRRVLLKLRTGGIAYFQIPTYAVNYAFSTLNYLTTMGSRRGMEMHAFPQPNLFKLISDVGCHLLEVREDGFVGNSDWISNTLLLQKK